MKNQSSNDNTKAKWERLADFTALCAWILTSTTMAVIAYSSDGMDFRGYYAAAHVLLTGGDPYDYSLVASVLLDLTGRAIILSTIHFGLAGSLHDWHGYLALVAQSAKCYCSLRTVTALRQNSVSTDIHQRSSHEIKI